MHEMSQANQKEIQSSIDRHKQLYSPENIANVELIENKCMDNGDMRIKYIKRTTYKWGGIKNRLIGLAKEKNGMLVMVCGKNKLDE
jgi:hypothetical protein